ncbi:MAG: hypothetical protein K0R18_1526 [Bacillales bacterium]|jgi:rubrerythrin|nr:hypothetical protein [Bacillales bacterium]
MKVIMSEKMKIQLLKAQQAEVDAVLMYKGLAEVVNIESIKEIFLQLAKDEGKHAAIIRKITGEVLMPKETKTKLVKLIYKFFGLKRILKLISNGEFSAAKNYVSLVAHFPEINEIRLDEIRHGEIIKECVTQL